LQALSSNILLYDEQLTSSTLLAAYSGDRRWIRRYNNVESKLTESINKTLALTSAKDIHDAAKST